MSTVAHLCGVSKYHLTVILIAFTNTQRIKKLACKLGFSLRHSVKDFAVFIVFACLRPRSKHLKADIS